MRDECMRNTPIIFASIVIVLLSFIAFNLDSITGLTLWNVGYSVFQPQTEDTLLEREGPALFVTGPLLRGKWSTVYFVPGPRGFDQTLHLKRVGEDRDSQQFRLCGTSTCYTPRSTRLRISDAIYPGAYTLDVFDLTTQTTFVTTVQIK